MASADYMRKYRRDNPGWADEQRRNTLARQRALAKLADMHPTEYRRLLAAELADISHDVPLGGTG